MAAHKHTKKNIENLKTWLDKTKRVSATKKSKQKASSTTSVKKTSKKSPAVVKQVKHEITHLTKGLNKEIKTFVADINKDVADTEKLINEFRKKANMLIEHIDAALAHSDAYTTKSNTALRDLREMLSTSFKKVGVVSPKITKLKIAPMPVKGYPNPHHHDLHPPLSEGSFKKRLAPNKYPTHLNVLNIATQKKKGS